MRTYYIILLLLGIYLAPITAVAGEPHTHCRSPHNIPIRLGKAIIPLLRTERLGDLPGVIKDVCGRGEN